MKFEEYKEIFGDKTVDELIYAKGDKIYWHKGVAEMFLRCMAGKICYYERLLAFIITFVFGVFIIQCILNDLLIIGIVMFLLFFCILFEISRNNMRSKLVYESLEHTEIEN